MEKLIKIFFFLLVMGLPTGMVAQVPTVTTRVDKKHILIGEQIKLTLQVTMPDNAFRLTWFSEPEQFGNFVIAGKEKIDSTYSNGTLSFSQTLTVTSFDSGRQVIPPLTFDLDMLQKDSSFKMLTDSIPVAVSYSPADSVLPFHDIKPIIAVKIQNEWWFWPAVIAAILLLIIIALIIYYRRKKKKAPENIFDNTLSPYEEAQKNFATLATLALPEKGHFNIFFSSLSDIVKKYLSRSKQKNLMSLTGEELILALKDSVASENLVRPAAAIRMGEAAKFAKFRPSVPDCASATEEIKKLIDHLETTLKSPADDI